jgi:hypothetical protein
VKDLITSARRRYSGEAQWAAWCGNLTADASTKAAAVAAVAQKLRDLAWHTGKRAYVPAASGNVLLVAYTCPGEFRVDEVDTRTGRIRVSSAQQASEPWARFIDQLHEHASKR